MNCDKNWDFGEFVLICKRKTLPYYDDFVEFNYYQSNNVLQFTFWKLQLTWYLTYLLIYKQIIRAWKFLPKNYDNQECQSFDFFLNFAAISGFHQNLFHFYNNFWISYFFAVLFITILEVMNLSWNLQFFHKFTKTCCIFPLFLSLKKSLELFFRIFIKCYFEVFLEFCWYFHICTKFAVFVFFFWKFEFPWKLLSFTSFWNFEFPWNEYATRTVRPPMGKGFKASPHPRLFIWIIIVRKVCQKTPWAAHHSLGTWWTSWWWWRWRWRGGGG